MRLLTLGELTEYLQHVLDDDPLLADIWVEAEVSNLRQASSGHYYFTLKQADAQLRAACFRPQAQRIGRMPGNGDSVLAHGRVSFYRNGGDVQLIVDMLRPAGVGLLHARLAELHARLEREGLFDEGRKRPLPFMPHRIGIVTSAQAAALQDILTVLRRRWPLVEVLLSPCLVQGTTAAASIVEALYTLYAQPNLDMIIVARGGGSLEDLWAFNEEPVVRAVFASPVPVVSGVGHETDTTLIDYVSDLRAPTPSAAAELAVPDQAQLRLALTGLHNRLDTALADTLSYRRDDLAALRRQLNQQTPETRIARQRQYLDETLRRAEIRLGHMLALQRATVTGLAGRLAALSPMATLERGYAIVMRQHDGQLISDPAQLKAGDSLTIQVRAGSFDATASSAE